MRAHLLETAGVAFAIEPAAIDESAIKREMRLAGRSASECAKALAHAKAAAVSARDLDALVIGADQLLDAGDEWYDKPKTLAEARLQLQRLRGRTHGLATAVCVLRGGERLWDAASRPELTMRHFSDAFLDRYIAAEGGVLLVGNHSGGTLIADTFVFAQAFYDHFGTQRRFHQLAHDLVFKAVGPA